MVPGDAMKVHLRVIWPGEAELRLDRVDFSYTVDKSSAWQVVWLHSKGKTLQFTGSTFDEMAFEDTFKQAGPPVKYTGLDQICSAEIELPTVTLRLASWISVEEGMQICEAICSLPTDWSANTNVPKSSSSTWSKPRTGPLTNEELVDELAKIIPGMREKVRHPYDDCDAVAGGVHSVRWLVIHLNDYHGWTYDEITEWLDTLDVDLAVQLPE